MPGTKEILCPHVKMLRFSFVSDLKTYFFQPYTSTIMVHTHENSTCFLRALILFERFSMWGMFAAIFTCVKDLCTYHPLSFRTFRCTTQIRWSLWEKKVCGPETQEQICCDISSFIKKEDFAELVEMHKILSIPFLSELWSASKFVQVCSTKSFSVIYILPAKTCWLFPALASLQKISHAW